MNNKRHLGQYSDVGQSYTRAIPPTHGFDPLRTWIPAYVVRELSICADRSMGKPEQFVSMLRTMADEIERIATVERVDRTPFLIDGLSFDAKDGVLTVTFHDNE